MLFRVSCALLAASASGLTLGRAASTVARTSVAMSSMHDFSGTTIEGKTMSLGDLKGKPTLILNVASL